MTRKLLEWSGQPGHKETIFDVDFRSADANCLATCSYDANVKVRRPQLSHSSQCSTVCLACTLGWVAEEWQWVAAGGRGAPAVGLAGLLTDWLAS